jgi:flavin reductase (DIM6/NTAB) family NADH-FMN oxidoreductase RutF
LSERFAVRGRSVEGQLAGVSFERGAHSGAVLLTGALATLEFSTRAVHEGGDHSIVVGAVLTVALPDPDAAPLVFHGGAYRRLGGR